MCRPYRTSRPRPSRRSVSPSPRRHPHRLRPSPRRRRRRHRLHRRDRPGRRPGPREAELEVPQGRRGQGRPGGEGAARNAAALRGERLLPGPRHRRVRRRRRAERPAGHRPAQGVPQGPPARRPAEAGEADRPPAHQGCRDAQLPQRQRLRGLRRQGVLGQRHPDADGEPGRRAQQLDVRDRVLRGPRHHAQGPEDRRPQERQVLPRAQGQGREDRLDVLLRLRG